MDTQTTSDAKIAKVFGLNGDNWMRHANPVSVWTRFAVLRSSPRASRTSPTRAWFIDRMVLLFEDLKATHPVYASWEY